MNTVGEYDKDALRQRLLEEVSQAGISYSRASLNAGLSKSYVSSKINNQNEPTVQNLHKLCSANGFSLHYIVFGYRVPADVERLLALINGDTELLNNLLSILERE